MTVHEVVFSVAGKEPKTLSIVELHHHPNKAVGFGGGSGAHRHGFLKQYMRLYADVDACMSQRAHSNSKYFLMYLNIGKGEDRIRGRGIKGHQREVCKGGLG